MTLFEHPRWPELLTWLYIRRGRDGVNGPRHRIEVSRDAPTWVFHIRVECAHCGTEIQPVRIDARGAWTFNASCRLDDNVRCARMPETTALCARIRSAMESAPPPQGTLFA